MKIDYNKIVEAVKDAVENVPEKEDYMGETYDKMLDYIFANYSFEEVEEEVMEDCWDNFLALVEKENKIETRGTDK